MSMLHEWHFAVCNSSTTSLPLSLRFSSTPSPFLSLISSLPFFLPPFLPFSLPSSSLLSPPSLPPPSSLLPPLLPFSLPFSLCFPFSFHFLLNFLLSPLFPSSSLLPLSFLQSKTGHPLCSFENNNEYVYDVQWSPIHPALFASVDGEGRLDFWNINVDTEVHAAQSVILQLE